MFRQLVPFCRHALPPRVMVVVGACEKTTPTSTGMLQRRLPRGTMLPQPRVTIGATFLNATVVVPRAGFDGLLIKVSPPRVNVFPAGAKLSASTRFPLC